MNPGASRGSLAKARRRHRDRSGVSALGKDRLHRLIEAGRSLVSEHEIENILDRLLAVAIDLTGARYAAIGVLAEDGQKLAEFITSGVDTETQLTAAAPPQGRGSLGLLVSLTEPLRLTDLNTDARASAFAPGHPPVTSFLGVPILIRGQAWGNLYVTDRQDGREFDEADEAAAVLLAAWAAIAVENARLSRQADQIRVELEGSVHRLEATAAQLTADLRASTADLAASRARLLDTAYAERQRIERDLHDGVQQDLIGVRVKLDLVAEAIKTEPDRSEQMIVSLGRQMDEVLGGLRSLARGIYPSLLSQRGLGDALASAGHRSPVPVSVEAGEVGRYRMDIEVAVYFCCLEALQNIAKHAGAQAEAWVVLRRDQDQLRFEVRDSGVGFDPDEVRDRHGLVNMRDRIDAVGGSLVVDSQVGHGTRVHGRVPIPSL